MIKCFHCDYYIYVITNFVFLFFIFFREVIVVIFTTFFLKFLDCSLSTIKNVFLIKEKYFLSSVCNSIAAVLFIFVADLMANSDSENKIYIAFAIFFANLLGSYFPPKLLDRFEADRLFIFTITAPTLDKGIEFADKLKEFDIPLSTSVIYDGDTKKTLQIQVYSKTKYKSNIIYKYLTDEYKYHIFKLT